MSPEAEAGPSRPTKFQDGEAPKNVGRKRKAGGDGKKGKIFLEDKAGLLSLMADVTGSKDTVVKSKLDNQRRRNDPLEMKQEETVAGPNKDKKKQRHEKKKADTRELRDAKFALMKEAKVKKQLRKGKTPDGAKADEDVKPKKKSVGFA